MKKIFYFVILSMLFFTSCSSDSSSESPSSNLLLKKIVEGDVVLGGSEVNYTYNGNKLVEIEHKNSSCLLYTSPSPRDRG